MRIRLKGLMGVRRKLQPDECAADRVSCRDTERFMCHESSGGGLEANFELRLRCSLQHLKSQRIRHICIHGCGAANDYSQNGDIEL